MAPFDIASRPTYRGKVKGIILDWSGTTVDAYVLAPATTFVEVFRKNGVDISMAEARAPMGLRKDLHIEALTNIPEIRNRWKQVHGRAPINEDVQRMYDQFVSMQLSTIKNHTTLLPFVAEVTSSLQEQGVKVGVSTGFIRSIVSIIEVDAKKQGYVPDASVAGDEVENGVRPKPFMLYRNLELMDIHPIQSVVKVDDTVSGIGEALEAGCWGVGIARYSNYMNINSLEEAKTLPQNEIQTKLEHAREVLLGAGAHYIIDTFDQLPGVIDDVNLRLGRGEAP
ncbi:MAG: phosphonoacetaldehyde hydrolase [Acidiferrobacteraceae bacterium]|nr:phosphonoacetaldehyde hydrolase [Acidiferrobacteraceae bacterium]